MTRDAIETFLPRNLRAIAPALIRCALSELSPRPTKRIRSTFPPLTLAGNSKISPALPLGEKKVSSSSKFRAKVLSILRMRVLGPTNVKLGGSVLLLPASFLVKPIAIASQPSSCGNFAVKSTPESSGLMKVVLRALLGATMATVAKERNYFLTSRTAA
ncbi:unannotated protein [freshwater metagenome]|uniref:Unannotated protein n=1 Tax=freshwater metagenome TaxID=449393 RepID=A0A6J7J9C9_9ZZZZ